MAFNPYPYGTPVYPPPPSINQPTFYNPPYGNPPIIYPVPPMNPMPLPLPPVYYPQYPSIFTPQVYPYNGHHYKFKHAKPWKHWKH